MVKNVAPIVCKMTFVVEGLQRALSFAANVTNCQQYDPCSTLQIITVTVQLSAVLRFRQ